ncbi:unnamed protein product, partial [Prorocentrum cordatum]
GASSTTCTSEGSGSSAPGWSGRPGENEEKQRHGSFFHKTKLCKFNRLGRCTRGELCRFAHGRLDMNPLPDLSRTKLCPDLFHTGHCRYPNCQFAHARGELRRHPFVLAGDRGYSGVRAGVKQQPRGAVAQDTAWGQDVSRPQADANLPYSDLARVLSKTKQMGQAGSSALYGDLADVLKSHGQGGPVDTTIQHDQASGGFVSPDFDSVADIFSEEVMAGGWWKNHHARLNAVCASPPGYHGAGVDSAAKMEHVAASFAWEEDSFYEALIDESAATASWAAAAEQDPEPRLLSPIYAPSTTLSVLPPFALP